MRANPLSYEVAALREALVTTPAERIGWSLSVEITLLFCVLTILMAVIGVSRSSAARLS
jgi:hypothetical protein